jgi:hypothetical protein
MSNLVEDKEEYIRVVNDLRESPRNVRMRPSYIRYTQESCSGQVHTGHEGSTTPIDVCIRWMLNNQMSFEDCFPGSIQCFTLSQDVCSLDNRRLFIARVLENRGILKTISVDLFPFHHDEVQRLRAGVPHWLPKADTTDRGNFIAAKSRFKEPGCHDLDFTLPSCERSRAKSLKIVTARVRKVEEELANVQRAMRSHEESEDWAQLGKNVKRNAHRLAKFQVASNTPDQLKLRIVQRITKDVDVTDHQRYVDFVNEMIADFTDSTAERHLLKRRSLKDDCAKAKERVCRAKQKMQWQWIFRQNEDVVLMTIPRSGTIFVNARHLGFDGLLRHASEYRMRLGFRGTQDGKVEIFAWPDEECQSLTFFERGCQQVVQDLRSGYNF